MVARFSDTLVMVAKSPGLDDFKDVAVLCCFDYFEIQKDFEACADRSH